jgi:hypothetical protein
VEFDPTCFGGDYGKVGGFALIPVSRVDEVGMEPASERTIGHVSGNIIHYSEDELYTSDSTFYGGIEAAPATTAIFS